MMYAPNCCFPHRKKTGNTILGCCWHVEIPTDMPWCKHEPIGYESKTRKVRSRSWANLGDQLKHLRISSNIFEHHESSWKFEVPGGQSKEDKNPIVFVFDQTISLRLVISHYMACSARLSIEITERMKITKGPKWQTWHWTNFEQTSPFKYLQVFQLGGHWHSPI